MQRKRYDQLIQLTGIHQLLTPFPLIRKAMHEDQLSKQHLAILPNELVPYALLLSQSLQLGTKSLHDDSIQCFSLIQSVCYCIRESTSFLRRIHDIDLLNNSLSIHSSIMNLAKNNGSQKILNGRLDQTKNLLITKANSLMKISKFSNHNDSTTLFQKKLSASRS